MVTTTTRSSTDRLDAFEDRLPPMLASMFRLQRSIGERVVERSRDAATTIGSSLDSVGTTSSTAAKTVAGTARWVGERIGSVTIAGMRQIVGQTRAQTSRTASAVESQWSQLSGSAGEAADDARRTVAEAADAANEVVAGDAPKRGYETWTKSELYDRAQELDVDGRSTMTKAQLVRALRNAA